MAYWEIFLIGVALSLDAFAVAVCQGLTMCKLNWKRALTIAAFFGGFQALMPLIGYLLGASFQKYVAGFAHWIAFGLLTVIGGKMIFEALSGEEEKNDDPFSIKWLTLMAFATSIDALATGLTFALLPVKIVPSILLIGVTTFAISLMGVALGRRFGGCVRGRAQVVGGAVLVLIGLKILLEGLDVLKL